MAKSWSWSLLLAKTVNHQASVDVPTPDYDETHVDPSTVELAVDNDVVPVPEDATVTFKGEKATVINRTGDAWAQGETLYIYVKAKSLSDADGDALTEMQTQIDANTSAIADLQTRVDALEAAARAVAQAADKRSEV